MIPFQDFLFLFCVTMLSRHVRVQDQEKKFTFHEKKIMTTSTTSVVEKDGDSSTNRAKVLKNLEKEGESLYKTHEFFKTLSNVMEHPETQKLLEEDFESTLLFVSCYHRLKKTDLSPHQKIAFLKNSFENSETRSEIVTDWTGLQEQNLVSYQTSSSNL